jgi:hypothetical protein
LVSGIEGNAQRNQLLGTARKRMWSGDRPGLQNGNCDPVRLGLFVFIGFRRVGLEQSNPTSGLVRASDFTEIFGPAVCCKFEPQVQRLPVVWTGSLDRELA